MGINANRTSPGARAKNSGPHSPPETEPSRDAARHAPAFSADAVHGTCTMQPISPWGMGERGYRCGGELGPGGGGGWLRMWWGPIWSSKDTPTNLGK